MLLGHRTGKPAIIAAIARIVVIANFVFTATAVVAQPVTGPLLAWNMGFSVGESWIAASTALYLLTGAFWLPGSVVWVQMRMRDLPARRPPAATVGAALTIFWLMIAKPQLW